MKAWYQAKQKQEEYLSNADDILADLDGGILRITFNRPEARNALTFEMYERLASLCEDADTNSDVRAILITGAGGKAFAAGTDISQFKAFRTPQDALEYEDNITRILDSVENCGKPIIAAIAGACTGGGAAIAACSDLRIAAEGMRFGYPVARTLGNCLSMSSYARLVALVGVACVKDLIFTARLMGAQEAKAVGLVNEVVSDHAELMVRAEEVARTVASHAPLTLRVSKEALRRLRSKPGADEGNDLVTRCYMSHDFREGISAFLEKRQPVWTGT